MNSKKSLDMTVGEPAKLLIMFAIPMLIGSVFQLMYNMVDTIVVGRFVSIDALAAIGATGSTGMLIMFMGNGLTNAISVYISQAEGAKNQGIMKKAVAHAVYLIGAGSLLLGLVSLIGSRPMMELLGTPENIIDQSVSYLQITGGLTVAVMLYNGSAAVLRAIGDAKTPLYFLIISMLLNIGLDLAFVLLFNMGVAGVAIATVVSQGVSSVLCIAYMFRRHPRLRPEKSSFIFDGKIIKDYLGIAIPMCAQSLVLCVGMFVITAVINSYGSNIVAAYTIGGKVEQLATISFSNIAFSFSVYAGQNFGAKAYGRIAQGLKRGIVIVGSLALVSTAVMWLFAEPIAKIFMEGDVQQVLEGAVSMIRTEALFFAALGATWTVNSALRGIGAVKITLASSVVELVAKISVSVLLPMAIGYTGIWLAAPASWVLGLVPSLIYLRHWFRKMRSEDSPAEAISSPAVQ